VALAFIPSSLLLSVTTFITTDVAPVPLLWVVPLSLYLFTFTLAFASRPPIPHRWVVAALPVAITVVAMLMMHSWTRKPVLVIPIHLLAFFVIALACHGELARRRPAVTHLTDFYLWIAVGGVLGGIFNVLVAPVVFSRMHEYAIVLAVACLALPWPEERATRRQVIANLLRTAGLVAAMVLVSRSEIPGIPRWMMLPLAVTTLVLVRALVGRQPLFLALCVAAALAIQTAIVLSGEATLLAHRSFYGRYAVLDVKQQGGDYHALYHGSTLHGAQSLRHPRDPLTYYHRKGPLGQIFAATAEKAGRRRVAVVGLGTGTVAAYGNAGETWTFYEIDPGIVEIARDPRYFTYLRDSPARVGVVLGDARLSLARAPAQAYDLIIVDAFNSDAIPVHLLTREALGVYLDKLAPGGIIALHLSNRYLELEPVVAALARERGLRARVGMATLSGYFLSASTWAAVARSDEDFGPLAADSHWFTAKPARGIPAWTDDYSSLLSVWNP
jgi:SAM-dependent methyltransferase